MSPSAKRIALASQAVIVAILVMRSFVQREAQPVPADRDSDVEITNADTGPSRISVPKTAAPEQRRARRPQSQPTTGVQLLSSDPDTPYVPVSGYVIDTFVGWSAFPDGYFAEGLALRNGAITLSGDAASTGPRTGTLQSPPLSLGQPSLAAPAVNRDPLPEGVVMELQISVTDDGEEWSPWYLVDRHVAADGKRVSPGMQPTLANANMEGADTSSSVTTKGPALRYRLGLSSSGVAAPEITDIRVWKREVR